MPDMRALITWVAPPASESELDDILNANGKVTSSWSTGRFVELTNQKSFDKIRNEIREKWADWPFAFRGPDESQVEAGL